MRFRLSAAWLLAAPLAFHALAQPGPGGKRPPQLPSSAAERAQTIVPARTAPSVSLSAPTGGSVFNLPAAITLQAQASASNPGAEPVSVSFHANGAAIATAVASPYVTTWSPTAPATYELTAVATDRLGVSTASAPVAIRINAPPTVSLASPADQSSFTAPAEVALTADARDADGSIAQVDFYSGDSLIATRAAAPFSIVWTGVPPGNYIVSAKARDNDGAETASTSVAITVTAGIAKLYFIHVDHLNTPRLVADENQRVVWRWDQQEPFGNNPAAENPGGLGAFDLPLRLPGQYFDKETNLHYNYFRDYDPSIGRYEESDPIGFMGGLNTFAYVGNSPIASVDMLGLLGSRGNQTYGCGSGANQPWVPNNPLGYPFVDCCNDHDRCYDDCINKPSKAQCDTTFCSCVAGKCNRYARGQARQCEGLARTYCDMVTHHGADAFNNARSKCPRCV